MLKVEEGDLEEVKRLISEQPEHLDFQNKSGQTALFLAVRRGNLAMVGALLLKKANINIRNKVLNQIFDFIS